MMGLLYVLIDPDPQYLIPATPESKCNAYKPNKTIKTARNQVKTSRPTCLLAFVCVGFMGAIISHINLTKEKVLAKLGFTCRLVRNTL